MSDEEATQPSVMPPQPKTTQLETVPAWAAELTREVRGARADISLVSNDLSIVKDRVGIIETWKNDLDARATRTSARVQQVSEQDLAGAAKLAEVIVWRQEATEKLDSLLGSQGMQTEILKRVDRFFDLCDRVRKHPLTKLVIGVVTLLLGGYAASKGLLK